MPATDARNNLAQAAALTKVGEFHQAIPLYESALATLERIHGGDQPELAECLQELGDAYEAALRLSDALRIHTRLLRLGERILGKTNPNIVAMLFKLAQLNEMLGRPMEALDFCNQALNSAKQSLPQNDPLSQQISDSHRYLTGLVQAQAQRQAEEAAAANVPPPQWQAEVPLQEIAEPEQATARIRSHIELDSHPPSYIDNRPMPEPLSTLEAIDNLTVDKEVENYRNGAGQMRNFAREMLSDMPMQNTPVSPIAQRAAQLEQQAHQQFQREVQEKLPVQVQQQLHNGLAPLVAPSNVLLESQTQIQTKNQAENQTEKNETQIQAQTPSMSPEERMKILQAGFSAAQNHSQDPQDEFDSAMDEPTGAFTDLPPGNSGSIDEFVPHAGNVGPLPDGPSSGLATGLSAGMASGMTGSHSLTTGHYPSTGEYNLNDLDSIRTGRRMATETGLDALDEHHVDRSGARAKRITEAESKKIALVRRLKSFGVPAVCLLVVIATVIFMLSPSSSGPAPEANKNGLIGGTAAAGIQPGDGNNNAPPLASTAKFGLYRTADDAKEVRLVTSTDALMVTGSSAVQLPYSLITNKWSDLLSAMFSSVFEKQLWVEQRDSGLKTQDDIVYYVPDGVEFKVVDKMRKLASQAQGYFMKTGEYPKTVTPEMAGDYAFVNPLTGKGSTIEIKPMLSRSIDGSDARATLESGLLVGEESVLPPLAVRCYAAVYSDSEDRLEGVRSTSFFIRGTDRNGTLLSAGQAGRCYVASAADTIVNLPPQATTKAAPKAKIKSKQNGKGAPALKDVLVKTSGVNPNLPVKDTNVNALPAVRIGGADKPTKLWLIANPAWPMLLMHHSLPLLLFLIAGLVYIKARMVAADLERLPAADRGPNIVLIVAAVILGLGVLAIMAQFVFFA